MKINKQFLAILIGSSIGLVSCGGSDAVRSQPSLVGTQWQLTSFNGRTLGKRLSKRVTLNFHKKRATGSAGCNRYFSNYKTATNSDSLRFNQIGSTRMLCKPRFMKMEHKFLGALKGTYAYVISNGELSLSSNAGLLKFKRP